MIVVRPVSGAADRQAFKQVPRLIYRDDPYWIPGEPVDLDDLFADSAPERDGERQAQAFVALDGATPMGRIAAIADWAYIDHHGDRLGFVGFYEAPADDAVAFALLNAAADWARRHSLTGLCGPVSPSMVYSVGLLVHGFGEPPLVGMPHNPAYYAGQFERWGMRKVKDLHSYLVSDPGATLNSEQLAPVRRRLAQYKLTSEITFRSLDQRQFERDVELVRRIYNDAFRQFWGFTPLTRDEMRELARGMRPLLDDDLVVFAERHGHPVGFLMAMPDVNQAAIYGGRVPLLAGLRTWWHWKGPPSARRVDRVRLDMLMVHPDAHGQGIGGLLLAELFRRVHENGYRTIEGAPVLEDASWIRPFRRWLGLQPRRVYRVYGCELTPRPEGARAGPDGKGSR
jgi:GNAT superfamily N-acetyltransferase